jgi:hypothetical protein
MILPGKHLRHDRALLGVGAEILMQLAEPRTISEVWERVRLARDKKVAPISFDWFVLSLSFLYAIAVVDYIDGIVSVRARR